MRLTGERRFDVRIFASGRMPLAAGFAQQLRSRPLTPAGQNHPLWGCPDRYAGRPFTRPDGVFLSPYADPMSLAIAVRAVRPDLRFFPGFDRLRPFHVFIPVAGSLPRCGPCSSCIPEAVPSRSCRLPTRPGPVKPYPGAASHRRVSTRTRTHLNTDGVTASWISCHAP